MVKWVPGYRKAERVSMNMPSTGPNGQTVMKHPKSLTLEWCRKNSIAPPTTRFEEFCDTTRNLRVHTATVTLIGKTVESTSTQKKMAERKCFEELLNHIANGGVQRR